MRLLPAVLLLALACGGSEEGGDDERGVPDDESGMVVEVALDTATMVAFPAAGVPNWTPMRERGIGIVHFDPGPRLAGRAADTLRVCCTDQSDEVTARLIGESSGVYRFEAKPGVVDAPGALEFGYEEIGLPTVEDPGLRRWRVFLGTRGGEPVTGWVTERVGLTRTLWEELLPTLPLFFVVPADSIAFHAAPDGPAVPFPLPAPSSGDYILWPLERSGDWLQVRAVTPSDYCADPPAPRQDTLWVRWRSEDGRPRVWYFTRGC